jgi:hypothetical protein
MTVEMVRVHDPKTGNLTTIPAAELAPGMVRCQIVGIEGEVWMDGSTLNKGEILHPPFPEPARQAMRSLRETFIDVYPRTVEEWEDGFRRDQDFHEEIALWLFMQEVFLHFTADRVLDPEQKRHIFEVINACVTNGADYVLVTTNPRTISKSRIREMVAYIQSATAEGMANALASVASMFNSHEGGGSERSDINLDDIVFGDDGPDEQAVAYFVEHMNANKGVPKPVVYRQPDGRFVVVDGRARIAAAERLGVETIGAYIIEGQPTRQELQRLRAKLNLRQVIKDPPDQPEANP